METKGLTSVTVNSAGLFVAVGGSGELVLSADGENWKRQSSGHVNNMTRITVNKQGLFAVLCNDCDGKILTSPDGVNWTQQTSGIADYLSSITSFN